jgi:hypothetical protein
MLPIAFSLIFYAQPQGSHTPARPFISNETGGIKGDIHDRKGDPVSGVRINLKSSDGHNWIAFADKAGRFQAGSLPPGEYQLELSKEKYPTTVYTKIVIKADAWLLGVADAPGEQGTKSHLQLIWIGPPKYEYPAVLIAPKAPPKTEKIPMH